MSAMRTSSAAFSQAFTFLCVTSIIEHHMDKFAGWDLRLNPIQKADELLMTVPLHAAADDLAFEHIESGEQRGRAMPLVIMRQGAGAAPSSSAVRAGCGQAPVFCDFSSTESTMAWAGGLT